jgi:hypothetical protein
LAQPCHGGHLCNSHLGQSSGTGFFCPDLALKSKLAFVSGHLCAWGDEEFHWAVSVIKNGIAIVTIWAKPA